MTCPALWQLNALSAFAIAALRQLLPLVLSWIAVIADRRSLEA
jgi:hypothetical protein